jgi:hypothetical protein
MFFVNSEDNFHTKMHPKIEQPLQLEQVAEQPKQTEQNGNNNVPSPLTEMSLLQSCVQARPVTNSLWPATFVRHSPL